MDRNLDKIYKQVIKCFPKSFVTIDTSMIHHTSGTDKLDIRLYINTHKFKQSMTSFSNHCDSVEGFITHINYEMQDVVDWKPIKELKQRIV